MAAGQDTTTQQQGEVRVEKPLNALDVKQAGMVPATTPIYFEDTYQFKATGKVVSADIIPPAEDDDKQKLPDGHAKLRIVLDQTIYHPQGGGQPSDVGTMSCEGMPTINVAFTHLNKGDGRVFHDCDIPEDQATVWASSGVGKEVSMEIDEGVRRAAAKYHSAGHLIDSCLKIFEYQAIKGMHFPECCYIEFQLTPEQKKELTDAKKQEVLETLQSMLDKIVSEDSPTAISRDENNVRYITLNNTKCPCGGTHVQNLNALAGLKVEKLKMKKGVLRVSYFVPA